MPSPRACLPGAQLPRLAVSGGPASFIPFCCPLLLPPFPASKTIPLALPLLHCRGPTPVPPPLLLALQATAATLGGELPQPTGGGRGRVLYPASQRASQELQSGLQAAGFDVTRLDTYDTVRHVNRQLIAHASSWIAAGLTSLGSTRMTQRTHGHLDCSCWTFSNCLWRQRARHIWHSGHMAARRWPCGPPAAGVDVSRLDTPDMVHC